MAVETHGHPTLQSYLNDFHKDFKGFRLPGIYKMSQTELKQLESRLDSEFDAMLATEKGRQELRENCWVV